MTGSDWTAAPLVFPNASADPGPDHTFAGSPGHDHDELFAELIARPDTMILPLHLDRVLVDADARLALVPAADLESVVDIPGSLKLYLGRVRPEEGIPDDGVLVAGGSGLDTRPRDDDEVAVIAILVSDEEAANITVGEWKSLREVSTRLDARDVGLSTRAVALANWHRKYTYSPLSGKETTPASGGWMRVDATDGSQHFPRTDPAVIIAVTDHEDRLLLASNTAWDKRVYSLIAGFVDPGESLEQAVVREVLEEAGVRVRDPQYLGSQPWPFPASLMLGFHAKLGDSGVNGRPDGVEIRALRWFSRAELSDAVERGEVIVPGGASISRAIIQAWHGSLPNSS